MRIGGIVSGFDTHSLIEQLMDIERRPVERMETEIEKLESTQDAWRQLNARLQSFMEDLSGLQDRDAYYSMEASASHEDISVSAEGDALARTYDLEVEQTAQAHRISSGEIDFNVEGDNVDNLSAIEDPLELKGELQFNIVGEEDPFTIEVNEEDSLVDIQDKINNGELEDLPGGEEDERDLPIDASIIGGRLVLEASETGQAYQIESIGGDEAVWGEEGLNIWQDEQHEGYDETGFVNEVTEGRDALFTVNGLEFESHSNVIDDIISHVTIDISDLSVEQGEDEPVFSRVGIDHDHDSAVELMEEFVDSFNDIYGELQDKGRITIAGDDIDRGPLQGDSLLRNLTRNMRTMVTNPISTENLDIDNDGRSLVPAELGIEVDRYGEMSFDESRFREMIEDDADKLYEMLAGERGIASRLSGYLEGVSHEEDARDGVKRQTSIGNRKLTLDGQIERSENRIEQREARMERREDQLWRQFTRMEEGLSSLHSESDWLTQQTWAMFG